MEELNLTPTQAIIFFVLCLIVLALLVRHHSFLELDSERLEDKTDKETDTTVQARYGAVIQIEHH